MNNVLLVSGIQQSDSVIHIDVSILFQILFPWDSNILILVNRLSDILS